MKSEDTEALFAFK